MGGGFDVALTSNLVQFCQFEANGNDSTPNGLNFTNNGGITFVPGKVGNAASIAASLSQYFSLADGPLISITGALTIAFWVNFVNLDVSATPIAKWNTGQSSWAIDTAGAGGNWRFYVSADGTAANVLTSAFAPSLATWYFIVAIHDPVNDIISFIIDNGTPETKAHSTNIFDGTAELRIGRRGNADSADLSGLFDQYGLWNVVLSPGLITQLFNGGAGLSYAQILALSQGTGLINLLGVGN